MSRISFLGLSCNIQLKRVLNKTARETVCERAPARWVSNTGLPFDKRTIRC